jgi:hypothetical protein
MHHGATISKEHHASLAVVGTGTTLLPLLATQREEKLKERERGKGDSHYSCVSWRGGGRGGGDEAIFSHDHLHLFLLQDQLIRQSPFPAAQSLEPIFPQASTRTKPTGTTGLYLLLLLKLFWARICKPFKKPRNRFPAWRVGTTTLFDVLARQAK